MAFDLSSIVKGPEVKPPKVVIYGVGGIGKTTWAAGAPKPIFLFTEDGIGQLDVDRFPMIRSWEDLLGACRVLYESEHKYETVVLDSIDFAERLLWEFICRQHGKEAIDDFGYQAGYGYALQEARTLLDWLDALQRELNMAVIVIGHSDVYRFEDPEREAYDRYDLLLHKRLRKLISHWTENLFFANYKAVTVKEEKGFNNKRARAVGHGERTVYTQERPAFMAKNRYNLPPEIELSWVAFESKIVKED